jgi:hypothetical protein
LHEAAVELRLIGPGDITGIDQRQIVRVEPVNLSVGFEPNYFPAIEFQRPDFPWMFTPAVGDTLGRLRPWLCLVVVRVQDGVHLTTARNRPLPTLTIATPAQPSVELPDLAESWAWAHTQVISQVEESELEQLLRGESPRAISRLLCPVKLNATTRYHACLVPAFEAGRRAGLGLEPDLEQKNLTPAWRSDKDAPLSVELPVYFHWEFTTGRGGDFEELASRLRGEPVRDEVGSRDMEVAGLGFGLPDLGRIAFEGALCAPKTSQTPPIEDKFVQFRHRMRSLLNDTAPLSDTSDPVVGPPVYGRYHAAVQRAPEEGQAPRWLGELNVDPRHRVAAALGTLVIQDQQEELMTSAWEQLAGAPSAVQTIRQAELGREVGRNVFAKRLMALREEQLLELTTPVHTRVKFVLRIPTALAATGNDSAGATAAGVVPTLDAKLRQSDAPRGVATAVFRRTLRPDGPVTRRLAVAVRAPALTGGLAEAQSDPPVPTTPITSRLVVRMLYPRVPTSIPSVVVRGYVTADEVAQQVTLLRGVSSPAPELSLFQDAAENLVKYLDRTQPPSPRPARPSPLPPLRTLKDVLKEQLDPDRTVTARLNARLRMPAAAAPAASNFEAAAEPFAVREHPVFPFPMYEALQNMSQEFLLPGAENVPAETVTLLQTNAKFVESFMIGLNHEMSRELMWREYPTDQRGTYFTRFWDVAGGAGPVPHAQLRPIHLWNADAPLGREFLGDGFEGGVVLLIRGEILRRYPGTLIYAVRADTLNTPNEVEVYPVFRGRLDPDIVFVGFSLMQSEARGDAGQPGYYFILQEQPAEPRFGMDVPVEFGADPGNLTTWSKLSWGHIVSDAAAFERLTHVPLAGRLSKKKIENEGEWGLNSAHMARITLQKRVRVAMHGRDLLPERKELK